MKQVHKWDNGRKKKKDRNGFVDVLKRGERLF